MSPPIVSNLYVYLAPKQTNVVSVRFYNNSIKGKPQMSTKSNIIFPDKYLFLIPQTKAEK